jgi:hypothetical protein
MTKISSLNGTFASFWENISGNAAVGNRGEEEPVHHRGNAGNGVGDVFWEAKKP